MKLIQAVILCCSITLASHSSILAQLESVRVDDQLPDYVPVAGISGGSLKSVGSETMNNMMSFWIEEFRSIYTGINAEVDAKGSSNAFPALIAGQANFGLMSRSPKKIEITDFKKRYGYEPTVLPTSIDMLAVYVHRDNPIEGLSFPELDAIFSSTRKRGSRGRAVQWKEFVEDPNFSSQPITCYGRNAASGTYGYFKDFVLGKGDYGPWVNELSGSSSVAQSVGNNPGAIGYSGIGFRTANVKVISVALERGGNMVAPIPKSAYNGDYPLSRFLYVVLNRDPRKTLDPTRTEFLKFIFSKQGQEQVVRDGYIPISAKMADQILHSIGIAH